MTDPLDPRGIVAELRFAIKQLVDPGPIEKFGEINKTALLGLLQRAENALERLAASRENASAPPEQNPTRVLADVRTALHVPEGYSIIEHAKEMYRRNLRYCDLYNTIQDIRPESFKDRWLFDMLKEQATRTDAALAEQPSEQNASVHALVAKWNGYAKHGYAYVVEHGLTGVEKEWRKERAETWRQAAGELERALASEPTEDTK